MCKYVHTAQRIYIYTSTGLYNLRIFNSEGGRKNRPGAVVDVLEHPLDQGKVHTHARMHTHTHTHTHTQIYMHGHTHMHTHTHTHTHTYTHIHMHVHTYARARTHMRARTHHTHTFIKNIKFIPDVFHQQVLLGYTSGLVVLWSLATKQVERRYHHNEVKIT